MDDLPGFTKLLTIMDRLRDPGGCPWDREQSYETLRGYLVEECYEVAEALDRRDPGALREELGDLLFQIVFLSRLAKEEGAFSIEDVMAVADAVSVMPPKSTWFEPKLRSGLVVQPLAGSEL